MNQPPHNQDQAQGANTPGQLFNNIQEARTNMEHEFRQCNKVPEINRITLPSGRIINQIQMVATR